MPMAKRILALAAAAAALSPVAALQGVEFLSAQALLDSYKSEPKTACSPLKDHGSFYTVELKVGSEEQKLDVVVDTGSDELVVPSCSCNHVGTCTGRCVTDSIPKSAQKVVLEYGSGGLRAAVMSGTVLVGSMTVEMHESMLMMYDNTLDLASKFEGILALGPPHRNGLVRLDEPEGNSEGNSSGMDVRVARADRQKQDGKHHGKIKDSGYFYTASFLEEAGITSFSLCFNRGSTGVLRFGETLSGTKLGSIGGIHWGLGLEGVSLGSKSSALVTCDPAGSGETKGTANTCGVIPDSGTTFIMAPRAQIDQLETSLCELWDGCTTDNMLSKVESCNDVDSLPPLVFHVTGTGSAATTLSIPSSAYIVRYSDRCELAFDVLEYSTEINGPVWILGMPLFFTYLVNFDVGSNPPAMSFDSSGCTSCSGSLLRDGDDDADEADLQWHLLDEPPRKSHVDVTKPL